MGLVTYRPDLATWFAVKPPDELASWFVQKITSTSGQWNKGLASNTVYIPADSSGLSIRDSLVYSILRRAGEKGHLARQSATSLTKLLHWSPATVKRTLAALEACKLIVQGNEAILAVAEDWALFKDKKSMNQTGPRTQKIRADAEAAIASGYDRFRAYLESDDLRLSAKEVTEAVNLVKSVGMPIDRAMIIFERAKKEASFTPGKLGMANLRAAAKKLAAERAETPHLQIHVSPKPSASPLEIDYWAARVTLDTCHKQEFLMEIKRNSYCTEALSEFGESLIPYYDPPGLLSMTYEQQCSEIEKLEQARLTHGEFRKRLFACRKA